MKDIRQENGSFIDNAGRQVILRGINMVHKRAYLPLPWTEEDFRAISQMGFNCIRLGMIWEQIAPAPGEIDHDFLDRLAGLTEIAGQYGIYIILDMHQDLFSYRLTQRKQLGTEGLEWYALSDGLDFNKEGNVWSDAYLTSEAVQRMFDNFWNNKELQGKGIQDHFASAWKAVASRFAGASNVIGYNLFNEPNPGSESLRIMAPILLRAAVALFFKTGRILKSQEQIINLWMDESERKTISLLMSGRKIFSWIVKGGQRRLRKAEKNYLAPFYKRVTEAIRTVDDQTMIMVEPFTAEFMGMSSALSLPDSNCAYMPHIYDITVDTGEGYSVSPDRMAHFFHTHVKDARAKKTPVLIGEWGAFQKQVCIENLDMLPRLFEKYCLSELYWDYEKATFPSAEWFLPMLNRPYVRRAAGKILSMESNQEEGLFHCVIDESSYGGSSPTELYLPGTVEESELPSRCEISRSAEGTIVCLPPEGRTRRKMTFKFNR